MNKENLLKDAPVYQGELSDIEQREIRMLLKRTHGWYGNDESLFWNIKNFIECSVHNHRHGRKWKDGVDKYYDKILFYQERVIDNYIGRCKKLDSINKKLREENKRLRKEIKYGKKNVSNT